MGKHTPKCENCLNECPPGNFVDIGSDSMKLCPECGDALWDGFIPVAALQAVLDWATREYDNVDFNAQTEWEAACIAAREECLNEFITRLTALLPTEEPTDE